MGTIQSLKVKAIDSLLAFTFFQNLLGKRWHDRWEKNYVPAEKELPFFKNLLNTDSIVFDIGANRGEISYYLATVCRCKTVYAFEPQKRMFGVLQGAMKKLPQVLSFNIGFSDAQGKAEISIPLNKNVRYSQRASLEKMEDERVAHESIILDTVDHFIKEHDIQRLDFIKCDTEGHELHVFKGAAECLKRLQPIIMVEVSTAKESFFDLMASFNYKASYVDKAGDLTPFDIKTQGFISGNYFFFPSKK